MLAKLIQPSGDKGWSFQVINLDQTTKETILRSLSNPAVVKAKPFIQGNSGDWIMIEFWTSIFDDIVAASNAISELTGLQYSVSTGFSKDEVFGSR